MQFKYKFTPRSGRDKIPLVDVIISNPKNKLKVSYPAMIDSGAFINVFHYDIADTLELDLTPIKITHFGGVGNINLDLEGKVYIVNLMVMQKGRNHSFESPVLFSKDIDPNGYPLLGRLGFFDQFNEISFDFNNDKFYLNISK